MQMSSADAQAEFAAEMQASSTSVNQSSAGL